MRDGPNCQPRAMRIIRRDSAVLTIAESDLESGVECGADIRQASTWRMACLPGICAGLASFAVAG